MKKIIISLAIIMAVGGAGFAATQAYFSDTKSSTGNTFTAGELNFELTADEADTETHTLFTETNMMPGVNVGPKSLHFKNNSDVSGKVKITISYTTADNTPNNTVDVNDYNFARNLRLVSSISDETEVREYWAGHIIKYAYGENATNALADMAIYEITPGHYGPTVFGLAKIPFYFDQGVGDGTDAIEWLPDASHDVSFTLQLNPTANNDYQNDGVEVTLTATMVQWGGTF